MTVLPLHRRRSVFAATLVVLLVTLASRVHATPPEFDAPFESFATGEDAGSIATGDLNHDGRRDLVLAGNLHTVSIMLASDVTTFAQETKVIVPNGGPQAVVMGQLNGDTNLDIVTANGESGSVSVLLGNGDGTVQARRDFAAGAQPKDVAIGDLDGDGYQDLAIADYGNTSISGPGAVVIRYGDGLGGFASGYSFYVGSGRTKKVRLADLNGDAKLDLVLLGTDHSGDSLSILLGNGNGTFGPRTDVGGPPSWSPWDFAVGDVNGDGIPDVVVVSINVSVASVFLGVGDGTLTPRTDYPSGYNSSIAIGDVNGDGTPDIAAGRFNYSGVAVLLGNGDGSFGASHRFASGSSVWDVAIGDLDGDGRADIATANQGGASLLHGIGNGTFGVNHSYRIGGPTGAMAAGDFDGDGIVDLVVANAGSNDNFGNNFVSILPGLGGGAFGPRHTAPIKGESSGIAVADLNHDGRLDIASVSSNSSLATILLGNGDGTFAFSANYSVTGGASDVKIGDLNGDGYPDLAVACGNVKVLLGNGDGTFAVAQGYGAQGRAVSVAIGDVNGDGRPDLVTANTTNFPDPNPPSTSVLVNIGGGAFSFSTKYPMADNYCTSVALGDLDGDGDLDIAASHLNAGPVTGGIAVLLGNGNGTFTPKTEYAAGAGGGLATIADFENDGRLDIAVVNRTSAVAVLTGRGDGTFGTERGYGVGLSPGGVVIADLNGDGYPDIATANGDSTVTVLLYWTPAILGAADEPGAARTLSLSIGPNPAYGAATIGFTLPRAADIRLAVYDAVGRRIAQICSGLMAAGAHALRWNAAAAGAKPGVFFAELRAGAERITRRFVVVR